MDDNDIEYIVGVFGMKNETEDGGYLDVV